MKHIFWILFLITGCSHLDVFDVNACGDLGPDGAHCAHTLTSVKTDIPKAQWDITRVGWMCMDAADFNNTETALDQACVWIKCTYKQQQQMETMKANLRNVKEAALKAREKFRMSTTSWESIEPVDLGDGQQGQE